MRAFRLICVCAAIFTIWSGSILIADVVIDDQFDDGNPATNTGGIGTFTPSTIAADNGAVTEASGVVTVGGGVNGGSWAAIRSVESFDANSATDTVTGIFEVSDFGRSASADANTTRLFVGFSQLGGNGGNALLESPGANKDGLWISLQSRENTNGVDNGQGGLHYKDDATATTLASWTWDQSLVVWDSASTFRSDRIATDLQDPLTLTLTSDATGYSLGFATTGSGVLPGNVSGTWAAAGVANDLSTAFAAVNLQGDASGSLSLSSINVSTPSAVPEPGSLAVLGLGMLGLIAGRRRSIG